MASENKQDAQRASGSPDNQLKPHMSLQEAMFLGIGGQIGSGWLFATLGAASLAGPFSAVSWIIGGVLITLIALTWMELSAAIPRSGAISRYPYISHGGFVGWVMGWSFWLATVSLPAIEAEAAITYFGGAFKGLGLVTTVDQVTILTWPAGILVGIALMVIFFLLNNFGIKLLGKANKWITWWKIIIPTLTFILLFFAFDPKNYTAYGGLAPMGYSQSLSAVALGGIAFAMMGFRQALDFGGEIRNPQRNIPLATIGIIVISVLIYLMLQIAFTGAINWQDMGVKPGDWGGMVGGSWGDGPLLHALQAAPIALLGAFASVLLVDAVISPAGAGWIYLGASVRVMYGLSVNDYLPDWLVRINRWGIPWGSLLVSVVIGCFFFFPAPSWYRLVGFISAALVMSTIMGGVMLPVMRRCYPDLKRPFFLRGAAVLSPISFLAALIIMYWAGFTTLANFFTAVLLGLCAYGAYYCPRKGYINRAAGSIVSLIFVVLWIYVAYRGGWVPVSAHGQRPGAWPFVIYIIALWVVPLAYMLTLWALSNATGKKDLGRGLWLIILMLATVTLSYFGEYGPTQGYLSFPTDTIIELVIGLVAYYWGVASGFKPGDDVESTEDVFAEIPADKKAS